jgi:hypothetical protein
MQQIRSTARVNRPPARVRRSHGRAFGHVPWWHSLVFVAAVVVIMLVVMSGTGTDSRGVISTSVTFRVTDATSGAPLPGALVSVGGQSLSSSADGSVELPVAPVEQDVTVQMAGYQTMYGRASSQSPSNLEIALLPAPTPTATEIPPTPVPPTPTPEPVLEGERVRGTVSDGDGNPIAGALVRLGARLIETDENGYFSIKYEGGTTEAIISASGYADRLVQIEHRLDVSLERFVVKGVYLNGTAAGDPQVVAEIIALIDSTELNAVVVDIKDGFIFYDSDVTFFEKAGAVNPTYDARALVDQFHEHGIYVIARQVAFKDPLIAEEYPNLAVKDEKTGKAWRGWAGEAWVNPLRTGLYRPNVDLAVEAARLGFDEIQYDYIRFPDGDLTGADFGKNYKDPNKRIAALTTLLSMTHDALRPLGVKLSADVFGWMMLVDDDQGIGQRFQDIAAVVDYISPMVYPSHFPEGSVSVPGHPNDFPYDTIQISVSMGMRKIPGLEMKMRPWLQDFSLPGMSEYGPNEIRRLDGLEHQRHLRLGRLQAIQRLRPHRARSRLEVAGQMLDGLSADRTSAR